MRTPTQPLADTPREATRDTPKASRRDERAYQGLTIAFVLLLLASLWLFR
jgi:hypothetical protein